MGKFLDRVHPATRQVFLEAQVIEKTHWTFDQIDEAPADRLRNVLRAWNAQAEYEADEAEKANRR